MKLNWLYRSKRRSGPGALVLMYHRVATVSADPWQIAVSPGHFEEQLRVLEENYHIIPVPELITRLREGTLSSGTVCLTFDDGYADNYFTALPLLEKYRCPATFFIVTGCIGRKEGFWWDTLGDLLLNAAGLPETLSIDLCGEHCSFSLDGEAGLTGKLRRKHLRWHYPAPPPGKRAAVYLEIYERLKGLSPGEQERAAQEIRRWRNNEDSIEEGQLPVDREQLLNMSRHPLADIGLHTHSHPALGFQSYEQQLYEIETCRKYLAKTTGLFLPVISYPHGHYNGDTLRLAEQQRLLAAFTTEEKVVTPDADPYRMGRFQVKDWDGRTFKKQLARWMRQG